jgi:hypothetical protein
MAAPTATTSSGLSPCAALFEELPDELLDAWNAGRSADEYDFVDLLGVRLASWRARLHGPWSSQRDRRSSARISLESGCTEDASAGASAVMNGRLMSVLRVFESSIFAFSGIP